MRKIILVVLVLFLSLHCFGTVSYLAVNKVTKELYVYEDCSNYQGIFWVSLAKKWSEEEYYLDLGYTYTEYPYKLDCVLFLLLSATFRFGIFFAVKLWRRSRE